MDKNQKILMGAVVIAAVYIITQRKAFAQTAGPKEIFTEGAQNGWRYFTDGTVISPKGEYYKNGEMVWYPGM